MSYYQRLDRWSGNPQTDVRNCFHAGIGKAVKDMDRDELIEMLRQVLNDRNMKSAECVALMKALQDSKRSKGGPFMKWLFG